MSYTQTTNLELYKDNADESLKNFRIHTNANMDVLDTRAQDLINVMTNAKDLLGQLGVDQNGDSLIDAATARGVLGAAYDNNSGTNLADVDAALDDYITNIGRYGKSGTYRELLLGTGTSFANASTEAQRAAIADGTFDGLYIGAYWMINSLVYRIADFNYYKRSGDADFNTNHIVIVPDASFGDDKMNDTNIVTGAYVGSKMYTNSSSKLNQAITTIGTDFGSYLAEHKVYLPNAVDSSSAQSAGAWYSRKVDLMNEAMVYGTFHHAKPMNPATASSVQHLYTVDKAQLALFRLNPAMVNLRYNYWLRDVVSSTAFARVSTHGHADANNASDSRGVRPAFCVKGTA